MNVSILSILLEAISVASTQLENVIVHLNFLFAISKVPERRLMA